MILIAVVAILLILSFIGLCIELRRGRATFMQRPFERAAQPQAYWYIIVSHFSFIAFLIWLLATQLTADLK